MISTVATPLLDSGGDIESGSLGVPVADIKEQYMKLVKQREEAFQQPEEGKSLVLKMADGDHLAIIQSILTTLSLIDALYGYVH